ncbi:MAG: ferrous iron transport protein B [Planctomycetota bacterium]
MNSTLRVVLAGNPNAGKTTLFNALTGLSAKVANYPGVTVELTEGRWDLGEGSSATVIDLPGAYSLSAVSAEEQLAIAAVAGLPPMPRPDAAVVVVDATELRRHLYLTLQIRELGIPFVLAVTMVDQLDKRGATFDAKSLERSLGAPVVLVDARRGRGLPQLAEALRAQLSAPQGPREHAPFIDPPELRTVVDEVARDVPREWHGDDVRKQRAIARWTLMSSEAAEIGDRVPRRLLDAADRVRSEALATGRDLDVEITAARYAWIDREIAGVVGATTDKAQRRTDRLDAILLHPIFGFALFAAVMTLVFQALFVGAEPITAWIESLVGGLAELCETHLPEGLFREFLVDAVIEGALSVLVFLPQILLMFLCLGILEDSGYMARIVVLTDRLMRSVGLHGRAFVPLLSGFACAVPAILATRTMERRRDRLLTMLVVPLTTCSARLPVYALLIAAMLPGEQSSFAQGALMTGMYLFGTVAALGAAWVLGRILFRGQPAPLVIQMPPYRWPQARSVLRQMSERALVFVREAGVVILACTIGMWLLLEFPREPKVGRDFNAEAATIAAAPDLLEQEREERLARLEHERRSLQREASYAGQIGKTIEPLIAPLGFDWKLGIGILGAFAAREVFVSTMGVVYGIGDEVDENDSRLRERLARERRPDGTRVFTPRTVMSLMIFFALACQCMSTLAAVRRESGGWRWPIFLFVYSGALAWIASFLTYRIGGWF